MRAAFATRTTAAAVFLLLSAAGAMAQSSCAEKAGRGWGSSVDSARFQAWEAVLQDTDWGMWAVWMASGAKVGTAGSGYKVSNLREKCGDDGSSKVCLIRARLCK
jgi:hypothetical protein